jgi:transcriptional regulator with XRE-family HTH domain
MSYRVKTISKLLAEGASRRDYIKAKLAQAIPSQIRALRLREEWTQKRLGDEAEMKQARISAMESPGEVNFTLETLTRIAAALKVALWVEFISYSELVRRESSYSQDTFNPVRLPEDRGFLEPSVSSGTLIPEYDYSSQRYETGPDVGVEMATSNFDTKMDASPYSMNGEMQMGAMYGA